MDEEKDVLEESPEEKQSKEAKKVNKQFDENIKGLVAVLKGSKIIQKGQFKIPVDKHDDLLDDFFKEEMDEAKKRFKEKAKAVIKGKVEFDKLVDQKKKEMDQAILAKKKEFNKLVSEAFSELESVDTLKENFYSSVPEEGEKAK